MSKSASGSSRVIQIKDGVIGPREPIARTLKPKKIGDYPAVPEAYLEIAKMYSSTRLLGPPICDELIALVQHMFTEEEASVVRHFKPFSAKSSKALAAAAHRPLEEVQQILDHLADVKFILLSYKLAGKKVYSVMPIVPGTFEWVLLFPSEKNLTDWHRGFAELAERLFEAGLQTEYLERMDMKNSTALIRYLPIGQSIEAHPMALPTDRLEDILDRYDTFGIGACQCRISKKAIDDGCGKPLEVCSSFGPVAEKVIQKGKMRRVEKKELIEIKLMAESNGLITWMMNVDEKFARLGNASCSCCSCCCPSLRSINEYNMPGLVAPPHFMPVFDRDKCNYCGKCARTCPVGAITLDTKRKSLIHNAKRCIGCGQCVIPCDKNHAVQMEPVKRYKKPPDSWVKTGLLSMSGFLKSSWRVWRELR